MINIYYFEELLRSRTDEITALQAREAFHVNSIGLLRKQQECQLNGYKQEVDQLKKQVKWNDTSI